MDKGLEFNRGVPLWSWCEICTAHFDKVPDHSVFSIYIDPALLSQQETQSINTSIYEKLNRYTWYDTRNLHFPVKVYPQHGELPHKNLYKIA